MADTNVTTNSEPKKWPVWLMVWIACILILCGIITICAPSVYWKFMDIILWIVLILAGTSWIINSFTNEKEHWWCLLSTIGALAIIIWIIVMCSRVEFIWTLSIWAIAIWALLRWIILIYFSLANKEQQKFWRWILTLWILLVILFIVIAFSNKDDAVAIVWVCIWISTMLDWICLLIMSFKANNDPSLQEKLIQQADENEIANASTTPTSLNDINNTATQSTGQPTTDQPAPAAQPETPPAVTVPVPVAVPTPESQAPAEAQPTTQTPIEQATPASKSIPVSVPTPEVQTTTETPTEENSPAPKAQQPNNENQA